MERRLNKRIETYMSEFKDNVKEHAIELGLSNENDNTLHQMVQYIYDYERLVLKKDDFVKRTRIKTIVNLSDRCCASRANGEQCTRRKKNTTTMFCGTHLKGTPHGVCDFKENIEQTGQTIEVWLQDIRGIVYYIDKQHNVYRPEDIMSGNKNPNIIAKCVKNGDTYSIPAFNI